MRVNKKTKMRFKKKTLVTDKDNTYLKKLLLLTRIGEDIFQNLTTKKSAHSNRVRMKAILLPLITEHFFPEISAISGLYSICSSG